MALRIVDGATKWVVSALVLGMLVWQRDVWACWWVLGSIVAAFNCKVLKGVVNEARPAGTRKSDPGMPSSHAQSLAFHSCYASLELVSRTGADAAGGQAVALCAVGALLSWLRVELGFHTAAQVLAGLLLGLASSLAWRRLGDAVGVGTLADGLLAQGVFAATIAAILAFVVMTVRGWRREAG